MRVMEHVIRYYRFLAIMTPCLITLPAMAQNDSALNKKSDDHQYFCIGDSVWKSDEDKPIEAYEATVIMKFLIGARGMFGRKDVWDLDVVGARKTDSEEVKNALEGIDVEKSYKSRVLYAQPDDEYSYNAKAVKLTDKDASEVTGCQQVAYVYDIYTADKAGESPEHLLPASRGFLSFFNGEVEFILNSDGRLVSSHNPDAPRNNPSDLGAKAPN